MSVSRWSAFVALFVVALGACSGTDSEPPKAAVEKNWVSLIDENRAFADLTEFAAFGGMSHAVGSYEKIEAGRTRIREKLAQAGFAAREIRIDSWTQTIPRESGGGTRTTTMKNITAEIPGRRKEAIAIGCHYDNKILPNFVGANDGASGVALTIELARVFKQRFAGDAKPEFTLYFVFFDGEEAIVDWNTPVDGVPDNCYGSRRMAADKAKYPIETLILLDMIGDADLVLTYERASHGALNALFTEEGKQVFGIDVFGEMLDMRDDHISFKEAGMSRVIDLIDFRYGPQNAYWHTDQDTVDRCSPRSLAKVGTLVLAAFPKVEAWLARELDG